MFTKLDMIDNQLVLTNFIKWRHQWCHSWRFCPEFSAFRACEYNNIIRFASDVHQPVLTNIVECRHDDVTVERFRLVRIFMKLDAWRWLVVKEELISNDCIISDINYHCNRKPLDRDNCIAEGLRRPQRLWFISLTGLEFLFEIQAVLWLR